MGGLRLLGPQARNSLLSSAGRLWRPSPVHEGQAYILGGAADLTVWKAFAAGVTVRKGEGCVVRRGRQYHVVGHNVLNKGNPGFCGPQ